MNILGIDCSSSIMSVSLKWENRLFETAVHDGFKHSENLMLQIDQLFNLCRADRKMLDLISVAAGPGSFTGLRIAMAAAKGMSLGTGADIVSVSTLDIYSMNHERFEGIVVPVLDAKKKQVYAALYKNNNKISEELDISPDILLEKLKPFEKILFTGPDAQIFEKYAENDTKIIIDDNFSSLTGTLLITAGEKKLENVGPDTHGSGPIYIRKSEAEISMFGE